MYLKILRFLSRFKSKGQSRNKMKATFERSGRSGNELYKFCMFDEMWLSCTYVILCLSRKFWYAATVLNISRTDWCIIRRKERTRLVACTSSIYLIYNFDNGSILYLLPSFSPTQTRRWLASSSLSLPHHYLGPARPLALREKITKVHLLLK